MKPGELRGFIEMTLGTKDSDAILFRQVTSNALVTSLLFALLLGGLGLIVSKALIAPLKRMTAIAFFKASQEQPQVLEGVVPRLPASKR